MSKTLIIDLTTDESEGWDIYKEVMGELTVMTALGVDEFTVTRDDSDLFGKKFSMTLNDDDSITFKLEKENTDETTTT